MIAIISDIHDNLVNLRKCLKWCREHKIEKIICCGDVANNDTLDFLCLKFAGEIFLVRGNMDYFDESATGKYENLQYLGRHGCAKIGNFQVGICHEPFFMDKAAENCEVQIFFYGHTHRPWQEKNNGISAINPGTLGGMFQRASFAVWEPEKGKIELKLLEKI